MNIPLWLWLWLWLCLWFCISTSSSSSRRSTFDKPLYIGGNQVKESRVHFIAKEVVNNHVATGMRRLENSTKIQKTPKNIRKTMRSSQHNYFKHEFHYGVTYRM